MSKQPILTILRTTAADFNPPLYYIMMHYWMMLFGHSEIAMRSLSLLAYCGIVIASIYFIENVFHITDKWVYLYVILIAFNPVMFYYAFEARMYTLFAFFAVLSWYAHATKNKKLFIVASAAGLYTHYYFMFVLGMQLITSFVGQKGKRTIKHATEYIIPCLLFLPWFIYVLPTLIRQTQSFWIAKTTTSTFFNSIGLLVTGYEHEWRYYDKFILLLSVVMTVVFVYLFIQFRKKEKGRQHTILSSLMIWSLVPYFALMIISLVKPLFLSRYLIFCSIGFTFILIYLMNAIKGRSRWIVYTLLVLGMFHYSIKATQFKHKEDARMRFGQIKALTSNHDRIYITDSTLYFTIKYYLPQADVKIYGEKKDVPAYVGLALMPHTVFVQTIPTYPQKAYLIHSLGNIEAIAVY